MKDINITGAVGDSRESKTLKAIALLPLFCIANVSALADAPRLHTYAKSTATITPEGKVVFGRLEVPHRRTILVNGRPAGSGETITSGSLLQTPNLITATVQIGSVGELDIASETDLLLTFDQRNIEVKVAAGNASLSTSYGVKGRVTMPDGEVCPSTPIAQAQGQQPLPPSVPAGGAVSWTNPAILAAAAADLAGWTTTSTVLSGSGGCPATASPILFSAMASESTAPCL